MLQPELEKIEIKVMSRIKHTRIVRARFHIVLHATSALVAIGIFVPVIQSFTITASQSGFTTYLSLISSDGSSILSSWKDFGLSLVESMPIIETSLILGLTLVVANALRRGTRYLPALSREHPVIATS